MNKNIDRLNLLREEMQRDSIDALIVPITDPHLGEYVPAHWRVIEWLTGFTGSAANVVVTADFAGLWTDSRYFVQAERELSESGFELVELKIPHTPEFIDWLAENMQPGSSVAADGRLIPIGIVKLIEKAFGRKRIDLILNKDYITRLWTDRPPMPEDSVFEHKTEFAGLSRSKKISDVRNKMADISVDFHLLTSLDDIAWLLNIRGSDVSYSPLVTVFALVSADQFFLFVNEKKIPDSLKSDLKNSGIEVLPYDTVSSILRNLEGEKSILITPGTTSFNLFGAIPEDIDIIEDVSIPTRLKAVKNNTEIDHIRKVMVKDGIALTRFFYWLEMNLGREEISELSVADKLLSFRMEQENCIGASFATIAGYNEHGALPHYCATTLTDVELKKEGIFLLDSGGQYFDGTTDVTRTITLGRPTDQQKRDFTLALKGTIGLARVRFPRGTKGYQIEILARKALWDNGLNYGHGTGHGVGFFLNVHEGPQTIGTGASGDQKTILEPGMLTADEPAIYREGEYGFRTENLLLCINDRETEYGEFYKFETVTLAYIDTSLITVELLDKEEKEWLNSYHKRVFSLLSPYLSDNETEWLKSKTQPL